MLEKISLSSNLLRDFHLPEIYVRSELLVSWNLTHYKLRNFFTFQTSFIPRPCWYSVAKPCPTLSDSMDCSTPSFPIHHYLLEFAQIPSLESVILSDHLILCDTLLLLPSIFPSIRVFSNESVVRMRWSKCWSFSISLFNEYSELILFKIDRLDFFAVQGTLKSVLQHHNSKASSPSSQFITNSLALSLLYGPTLTSIHDSWKNHSFD